MESINLIRVIMSGDEVKLRLKKVTRKRFCGVMMAMGIPARGARVIANVARENGESYRTTLVAVLAALRDAKRCTFTKETETVLIWLSTGAEMKMNYWTFMDLMEGCNEHKDERDDDDKADH